MQMNTTSETKRRERSRFGLLALGLLTTAFFAGYGATFLHSPSASKAASRPAATRNGSEDQVNFDLPYASSRRLSGISQAQSLVSFLPVAPASLGTPLGVYTAADLNDRATKTVAFVYQHPTFGRFMIIEGPQVGTQGDLESLVTECNGPNPCDADWHLSKLSDGTVAVVHVGNTGTPGATTGVMWLNGRTFFDLEAPASTITEDAVLQVANIAEGRAALR